MCLVKTSQNIFQHSSKPSSSAAEAEMAYNILSNSVINYFEFGDIILMGDFNRRTGHTQGYALCDRNHSGRHSIPLPDDYIFDFVKPRHNRDKIINTQGSLLLEICRESRLRILNGRVAGDCLGNFTFYNTNGQSTNGYWIVSETLLNKVEFFNILPPNELSDHCIIRTSFNFDCGWKFWERL